MKALLQPGKLVSLRGREWVVLPSGDKDLLIVKPLGGSDDEIAGIYLPLEIPGDTPVDARFPPPTADDLGDTSVYDYYPYQIISIDYIKSDVRRDVFIEQCPEFVIVDEAHTCTKPAGASAGQQQRYHLLSRIAAKPDQHLVMLTATPHSGKSEEFHSLLGLLESRVRSARPAQLHAGRASITLQTFRAAQACGC